MISKLEGQWYNYIPTIFYQLITFLSFKVLFTGIKLMGMDSIDTKVTYM